MRKLDCVNPNIFHHKKIEMLIGPKLDRVNRPLEYNSLSALSAKLYFFEISQVHQKLWLFKCTMLKTLNSNFLE